MRVSSHMGLRIWNELLDLYDHEQLADNWAKVDAHDHTPGRGVLIPTEGISEGAITVPLLSKEVQERILSNTIVYGEEETLAATTPATPSADDPSLIIANFTLKSTELVKFEVKVEGKAIATPEYEKSSAKIVPLIFPVGANKAWEWKNVTGEVTACKFRTVLLT